MGGEGEPGLSEEEVAVKELREETGFVGRATRRLAVVHTNTGTTPEEVAFVHVEVTGRSGDDPEAEEAISGRRPWPVDEIWRRIRSGEITDAFTIQAVALLANAGPG